MRLQILVLFIFSILSSCSSQCFQVYEIKEIIYDVERLSKEATTKDATVKSEVDVDLSKTNKYHYFTEQYSYSESYHGIEVIDRLKNKRFIKGREPFFEEVPMYGDLLGIGPSPQATGETKTINGEVCVEYLVKNKYKLDLLFYASEKYPYTHIRNMPNSFPNHLVSRQAYSGSTEVVEYIYGIKQIGAIPSKFSDAIKEVESISEK